MLQKNDRCTINPWLLDNVVHIFPKGISPKVNVIEWLEFELTYYNCSVYRIKRFQNVTLYHQLLARNYLFYLHRGQFHQSHQLVWQKANCSKHSQTPEPMLWKNVSTSAVRRRHCEAGLYGRNTVKKLLLRKQNNVKRLHCTKTHKDYAIEQWNKVPLEWRV